VRIDQSLGNSTLKYSPAAVHSHNWHLVLCLTLFVLLLLLLLLQLMMPAC
jgi:hypothetical protein